MTSRLLEPLRPVARRLGLGKLRRASAGSSRQRPSGRINETADAALAEELRGLGVDGAVANYERALRLAPDATVAYKLARTHALVGRLDDAIAVLRESSIPRTKVSLLELQMRVRAGASTSAVQSLVPAAPRREFMNGLSLLAKTVVDEASLETFRVVARQAKPAWADSPNYLGRLGHAHRRGGQTGRAIGFFEQAVSRVKVGPQQTEPTMSSGLTDPWIVLDDVLSVAGDLEDELFPVAATLLGFVREQGFISHDYDMDFGMRVPAAHAELRERFRADWRFEVERGRADDVMKLRHINGSVIDIYLFRRDGDGWVKQSHVYGWRFEDFRLEKRHVGSALVWMPADPERYLTQMYGADWRVPMPGFESGLYAPNCYVPDRDEMICAVLNKVVSAARNGRLPQVEQYRTFLHDRLGYKMPAVGGERVDAGVGPRAVDDSSAASKSHDGADVASTPYASELGVKTIIRELTEPHKSRSHEPLTTASFRLKMDERIRRRRYVQKHTSALTVSAVLARKAHRDRVLTELGLPIPQKMLESGSVEDVMRILDEQDECVVKPAKGSGSRGVLLLRRQGHGWLNLRTEQLMTRDEIAARLPRVRIQQKPVRRWTVEQLVIGDSNASGYPMDYKFFMFQQRCGLILAKRHLPDGSSFRWFSPEWSDVDTGKYRNRLDADIPLPADPSGAIEMAASVSTMLPTSFIRVDLLAGRDGLKLGELAPFPGTYHRFEDQVDAALGTLWEVTDAVHGPAFLKQPEFGPALRVMRRVSGVEVILPD